MKFGVDSLMMESAIGVSGPALGSAELASSGVQPAAAITPASIAFICTANVCRSVMAHAIGANEVRRRALSLEILSAGIFDFHGAHPAENAWMVCLQNQTPVPKSGSTFVGHLDLSSIHHFLVMENRHRDALVNEHQIEPSRVSLLGAYDAKGGDNEIEDPMNQGKQAFEHCYARIRDCVRKYLDTMRPQGGGVLERRKPDDEA